MAYKPPAAEATPAANPSTDIAVEQQLQPGAAGIPAQIGAALNGPAPQLLPLDSSGVHAVELVPPSEAPTSVEVCQVKRSQHAFVLPWFHGKPVPSVVVATSLECRDCACVLEPQATDGSSRAGAASAGPAASADQTVAPGVTPPVRAPTGSGTGRCTQGSCLFISSLCVVRHMRGTTGCYDMTVQSCNPVWQGSYTGHE